MTVVTISRELGSGGRRIAAEVAGILAYHFVDKTKITKILGEYGLVRFGQEYDALPRFWSRFDSQRVELVNMLDQVILALAAHGNVVILGRGGFALLAGYADVINVRTQAPLPIRIRRIMEQQNISRYAAETLVNENDVVRAKFVKSSYDVHWDNAGLFDLVIDTSKVYPEAAVNWIAETTKNLTTDHRNTMLSTVGIDVNAVLAHVISQTLDCQDTHVRFSEHHVIA